MILDDRERKLLSRIYASVPHTFQEQLKVIQKLQTETIRNLQGLESLEKRLTKNKTLNDEETTYLQNILSQFRLCWVDDDLNDADALAGSSD